ncbi:MAG: hypothetical protein L0216_19030 [Planctomycetales bacterium]|nr:hypothetical protein [Planctomycetales bacterium]
MGRAVPLALAAALAAGPRPGEAQEPPGPPAAAPEPAPAPRKYELRHSLAAGDEVRVETIRRKTLSYVFAGPGGEVRDEVLHVAREVWRDRILEAAGGRPTAIERTYEDQGSFEQHLPTKQWTRADGKLKGRVLRLRERSGALAVEPAAGGPTLPEDAAAEIRLEPEVVALLPAAPVAVGDSWKLPPAEAARLVPGASVHVSAASGRLAAVEGAGDSSVARLEISLSAAGRIEGAVDLTATLSGTAEVALGARRLRRADLSGRLTLRSAPEAKAAGRTTVAAEGPIEVRLVIGEARGPREGSGGR